MFTGSGVWYMNKIIIRRTDSNNIGTERKRTAIIMVLIINQ